MDSILTKQLKFVVNKLLPKAAVGTDDRATGLGPCVRIQQGHAVVFHEIGNAEGGRAAHSCGAVQQRAAIPYIHAVDVIGYGVEKVVEVGIESITHRHMNVLNVFKKGVNYFCGSIDDRGDAVVGQDELVVGGHSITHKKAVSYLREAIDVVVLDSLEWKDTRHYCGARFQGTGL